MAALTKVSSECLHFFHLVLSFVFLVEKDLNVGDHGYARRQPKLSIEEEAGLQTAEEERPCSLCQHYKAQLEQQQQHTARLQREASSTFIWANSSIISWLD